MSNINDKTLDKMLADWASKSSLQPDELQTLNQQVQQRVDAEVIRQNSTLLTYEPTRRNRPVIFVAIAVAASIIIAISLFQINVMRKDHRGNIPSLTSGGDINAGSEIAWSDHLDRQQRLLNEFQEVFGNNIAWIIETDGRSNVGLLSSEMPSPNLRNSYVTVQLKLVARTANRNEEWKVVKLHDLVACREEIVERNGDSKDHSQLSVWAFPVDNTMISVDIHYKPLPSNSVQFDISSIQQIGKTTQIQSFEHNGVEYRLFQTVDVLKQNRMG